MAQSLTRIALVLLAAGAVIAAAIALTPRFDPRAEEAAQIARAKPPAAASLAALRQAIAEAQSGVPDYARAAKARAQLLANLNVMQRIAIATEGGIPVQTNQSLLAAARRQQQMLAKLGPLHSIAYLGGGGRYDRFRVTFQGGVQQWGVALDQDGRLADFGFGPAGIPTPQDYIDNYARFALGERAARMATQLAILLGIAALGRRVLRLRI